MSEAAALAGSMNFRDFPNVRVVEGSRPQLIDYGPFDLLVLDDGGTGKDPAVDSPIGPGDGWLAKATEIRLSPTLATIIGVRIR